MQKMWVLNSVTKVRISQWIYPIDQFGKMAIVHSVFDHSFNLWIGGRLINVANYAAYLSSFGLYLPDKLFNQLYPSIQKGNKVRLTRNSITAYARTGVQKVVWEEPKFIDLNVSKMIVSDSNLILLKDILDKKDLKNHVGLEMTKKMLDILHQLAFLPNESLDDTKCKEIIEYLIGRGKGLTPSGDDLLVAYLSILQLRKDSRQDKYLDVLQTLNLSTTDVSKEYVFASIEGYVNSVIYRLYQDLIAGEKKEKIKKDVADVMQIGHTSGKDMCLGMLLGLQSVR